MLLRFLLIGIDLLTLNKSQNILLVDEDSSAHSQVVAVDYQKRNDCVNLVRRVPPVMNVNLLRLLRMPKSSMLTCKIALSLLV